MKVNVVLPNRACQPGVRAAFSSSLRGLKPVPAKRCYLLPPGCRGWSKYNGRERGSKALVLHSDKQDSL
jgi:hypothetical protein